jgi:ATP-dependent helicase/nuclease subunit B
MRVATIPPGAPFLATLVEACLDGSLGFAFGAGERDFSLATICVPTRRAARALAHAFAERLRPEAVLLPRIVPLGEPDLIAEELALLPEEAFAQEADAAPAIHPLRRRLILTNLVEQWRRSEGLLDLAASGDGFTIGESFADSFALAGDLARIIDEGVIERVDWSRLSGLVDAPFDAYFQQTRRFIAIAAEAWPAYLAEAGLQDAAARRDALLRAEARRFRDRPPTHPVVAAGSTGTMPATAELLAAVARLPAGAVVLPGLDLGMDEADWELVAQDEAADGQPGHPQGALKRLLGRLGVARGEVAALGAPRPELSARAAVLGAAALPADATGRWLAQRRALEPDLDAALAGVTVMEAADERDEALAIAVALREVLETPDRTAALVTPDRALADRVAQELGRWGVAADDSAGSPLMRTPFGALADLVLHAMEQAFAPGSVVALLANPCLHGGGAPASAEARAALELLGFRGVPAVRGVSGLSGALADAEARRTERHAHPALARVTDAALAEARALLAFAVEALTPLAALLDRAASVADWAAAHGAVLDALAGGRAREPGDGEAATRILDALAAEGAEAVVLFADYAAIYRSEARAAVVAPPPSAGRIRIWGLLEARLLTADRIILGGLNEGVWPPAPAEDMLLNRAMRAALGLPLPERRIGQSAHDFAQALGAPDVVVARALAVEGEPKVASRFLRRLDAFVGADRARTLRVRGEAYLANARMLDEGNDSPLARRPNPKPPAELQPGTLFVTDAATLARDPYAIYARDVLGLKPVDPVDPAPDARDRGQAFHAALEAFVNEASASWPDRPLERLLEIGRSEFAKLGGSETVAAFWWPTFEAAARWFVGEMDSRRAGIRQAFTERSGRLDVALADGTMLTLRGEGDLIETLADGALSITDYKTGAMPGHDEVAEGLQPQLTLMAALAQAGVIDGVPGAEVRELRYLKLGRESRARIVKLRDGETPGAAAARHLGELAARMDDLRAGRAGYISRRRMKHALDEGPYDHLARVSEWQAAGAEADEDPSQEG